MDDRPIREPVPPASPTELLEIRRIVDALAFATDAGDWGAFLEGFAPDATGDYGELGSGPIGELAAVIRSSQERYLGTMNFVGTHLARPLGAEVIATSYVISHHFRMENGSPRDDHVGTRYTDRFARRAGAWKISHREARVLWFRQDEIRGGWL